MTIGYHLHVPFSRDAGGAALYPRHHALFVEELGRQSGRVKFFAFESDVSDVGDFPLDPSLVEVVSLGPRLQHPAAYVARRPLARIREAWSDLDAMIVRGPGPLLPRILRMSGGPPRVPLIMGDLRSWRQNRANPSWRNASIYAYRSVYLLDERLMLRRGTVLVNNAWLRTHLEKRGSRDVREIFTSTLTDAMAQRLARSARNGVLPNDRPIRLLNTGRIVEEKGIHDLVEAMGLLRKDGFSVELELVGWAPDRDPTGNLALKRAADLGYPDAVTLTGYLSPGDRLLERYEHADIYLFGSPTEWGMPQSLMEAMAAGLPSVTTDFEGLRGLLTDGQHALIVPPKHPRAICDAVRRLIEEDGLRTTISMAGRQWAAARTNERSVAEILRHVADVVQRGAR